MALQPGWGENACRLGGYTVLVYILASIAVLMGIATLVLTIQLQRARRDTRQLQRYVSKLQNAERTLKKHAFFDPLTGLPNRLLLMDRFQRAIQHAKRSRTQFAVLMVDLNKFKAINDTYGHAAGDKVLVRSTDTVARLGGDEFVLIIESLTEREQIGTLGQKLIDLLAEEILLDSGEAVSLGGSVGFAWYPSDGDSLKDILEVADEAMYFCKTSGLMAL